MKKQLLIKTEQQLMQLEQAAEYLSLTKRTLYAYCYNRVIKYYKVRNRKIYFLKSDLDNFVINDNNLVKSTSQIDEEARSAMSEGF